MLRNGGSQSPEPKRLLVLSGEWALSKPATAAADAVLEVVLALAVVWAVSWLRR
jgi:hypothetical protein